MIGVHVDQLSDTLFAVVGTEIVPYRKGASKTGIWRSKVFIADNHPAYAWGRIEGEYPAILRLYGDSNLVYTTPSITSGDPFRLPAGRYREFQIEVESASPVMEVRLAERATELKG